MHDSDPGLLRLRAASRTVLSSCLAVACMYLLGLHFELFQPYPYLVLAWLAAMLSSATITACDHNQIHRVMSVAVPAAILAVALSLLLRGSALWIQLLVLACAVFVAFYVRQFGRNWTGCGIVSIIMLLTATTILPAGQTVWIPMLCVGIGVFFTWLASAVLLPDRRRHLLQDVDSKFMVQCAAFARDLGAYASHANASARCRP